VETGRAPLDPQVAVQLGRGRGSVAVPSGLGLDVVALGSHRPDSTLLIIEVGSAILQSDRWPRGVPRRVTDGGRSGLGDLATGVRA
jgi:hypothetical protein